MKKILSIHILLIILSTNIFCQNLVPNHSFENAWSCPYSYVTDPLGHPYPDWINPNKGTPDLFHVCSDHDAGVPENFAGYLYPYEGVAYAGIVLWEKYFNDKKDYDFVSREYIQTKLKEPLKRNKLYCVKLRYANAAKTMYSVDALGVALTRDKIESKKGSLIIQMPQVINRPGRIMENYDYWEEFCGTYRAKGREEYLTIGNFWDNESTTYKINERKDIDTNLIYAYYLIDDVRLFEIDNTFECGCHNDFAFGSDRLADDFDPETGYNSLTKKNDLADNTNNNNSNNNNGVNNNDNNNNNSGNNSSNSGNDNSDSNSSGIGSENNSNTGNNSNNAGNNNENNNHNNNGSSGNNSNPFALKESEITETAFNNAKIGDKFNLNRIFFEFGSSELLTISYIELDRLYNILIEKSNLRIEIRGHTDNIGSTQYNKTLSVKRAEEVYNYLSEKGIEKTRMKYRGFGNKVPVSDNDTEEGRSLNRRVEIIITEL